MKLSHLYLGDGPAPPIDFLHMRVSPWLQFRAFPKSLKLPLPLRERVGVRGISPVCPIRCAITPACHSACFLTLERPCAGTLSRCFDQSIDPCALHECFNQPINPYALAYQLLVIQRACVAGVSAGCGGWWM